MIKLFNVINICRVLFYTPIILLGGIVTSVAYDYVSFKEDETFAFYKLEFTSNFSMMKYINALKKYYYKSLENYDNLGEHDYLKKWLDLKESNCDCEANLYESKVSPILKFIHERNINSCGWFTLDEKKCKILKKKSYNYTKKFKTYNLVESFLGKSNL